MTNEAAPAELAAKAVGPVSRSERALLFLIMAGGFVLGLAPFCFLIQKPLWLVFFAFAAAVVVAVWARTNLGGDRVLPNALDRTLAAVSAVYPSAVLGCLLALVYFAVQLLMWLFNFSVLAFGGEMQLPAFQIALAASILVLILGGFGFLALAWNEITKQLYPKPSERSTPLSRVNHQRRRILAVIFLVGVLLALFLLFTFWSDRSASGRYILLQFALMVASVLVWSKVRRSNLTTRSETAVETVQALLKAAGFTVNAVDGSEVPEAPGVLRSVDYFAEGYDRKLVIDVKTGHSGPVGWNAVSALGTAAWALAEARKAKAYEFEPVLIVVDGQEHENLATAARREGVQLIRLSQSAIERALDPQSGEENVRRAAIDLLKGAMTEVKRA